MIPIVMFSHLLLFKVESYPTLMCIVERDKHKTLWTPIATWYSKLMMSLVDSLKFQT